MIYSEPSANTAIVLPTRLHRQRRVVVTGDHDRAAVSHCRALVCIGCLDALIHALALFGVAASLWAQPSIPASKPADQIHVAGATVTFSVDARGESPLSYQWLFYRNASVSSAIAGETNATLVLTNVQPVTGRYAVRVTDGTNGSALSRLAKLTVVLPPVIQWTNPTASLFADLTLTATNIFSGASIFQWLLNGAPIPGAVTNPLSLRNIQKTNSGDYALAVNYTFGSTTSQVSRLRIVPFNSLYEFGFSWTDTRGDLHGCFSCPSCYWNGRSANGPMWPELLSTNFGLAYAETNNYAVCNSAATSVWALGQVNTFPMPPKPELSAYFAWLATDDITARMVTNQSAWDSAVQTVTQNYSNTIHRLYARGARQIVVEGTPDLSVLPYKFPEAALFGTNAAGLARYSSYLARFNQAMLDAVEENHRAKPDLRVIPVNAFAKLNEVIDDPARFGFTKASVGALGDPALADKSFTGPGSSYVFWDDLHGTTKLNEQIATWHWEALTTARLEEIQASLSDRSVSLRMIHLLIGRDYTLQRSADLDTWSEVETFTASAGTNKLEMATSREAASVFYRLSWNP